MLMSWVREVRAAVVGALAVALVLAGATVVAPLLAAMILLLRFWPGNQTWVSRLGLSLIRRLTHRLRLAGLARAIPQAVRSAATVRTAEPSRARFRASLAVAALAMAGLLAGCHGIKVPVVLEPSCSQLEQVRDIACSANPEGEACAAAREALAAAYPNGCPTPEPSSPPVTQPTPAPDPTATPTDPPTAPPAGGCVLAGEPSQALPDAYQPRHQAAVLAAIRRAHPSCTSGDCLIDDETQQGFQAKVEAEVRAAGLCAGQHTPGTDEIAVAAAPAEPWEGYDVFAGDDSEIAPRPPGTARRTIVWAKYRGAWYPPPSTPAPTPTPTPGPTSTPTPTSGCGAPRWESYVDPSSEGSCGFVWGLSVGRQWIDATLKVRKCCAFCQAIGMGTMPDGVSPRCECPLRPEGHPERDACEAEVGAVWESRAGALVPHPMNRAKANCEGSGCQVSVCTAIQPRACSEWVP